jgi:hypothetical protein
MIWGREGVGLQLEATERRGGGGGVGDPREDPKPGKARRGGIQEWILSLAAKKSQTTIRKLK